MSVSKRAPDWSKHIWGNQRAAVRVSKQCPPSSLLTWHNRASKLDFCVFSAGRWGSVLFGLIVFRAQWALLPQIVMTQLSCRWASPQCSRDANKSTALAGKMNASTVAMPLRTHRNGISKIMTMCVVVCTALPLLSVTAVTLERKQV